MLRTLRWTARRASVQLPRCLSTKSASGSDKGAKPPDDNSKTERQPKNVIKARSKEKIVRKFEAPKHEQVKVGTSDAEKKDNLPASKPSSPEPGRVIQPQVIFKRILEQWDKQPFSRQRGQFDQIYSEKLPPPESLDFLEFHPHTDAPDVPKSDRPQPSNPIFDAIDNLEPTLLMLANPMNQFEEWMQWTIEGKLWRFPIDNEQDWETEKDVPFHEHMFLDRHVDKSLRKSPPVSAFLDLVCAGLAQNPHFTVEQKREHLRWYAEYFKDKLDSIDASVREELRLVELERKARATITAAPNTADTTTTHTTQ